MRSLRVRALIVVLAVAVLPLIVGLVAGFDEYTLAVLAGVVAVVVPFAVVLAWWLGWRMVRPVEQLLGQVRTKLAFATPGADIHLARVDEFGQLARAFNALLETLEERNRANEGFVADLAHEFKNPVAAIRACAERLVEGPVDEARAARIARILDGSSRRLDTLVTELLELARAQAGLAGEERVAVDLVALAGGVVADLRADERYGEVAFTIEPCDVAIVAGVSSRLETALRNLLDNAASFAGAGGEVHVSAYLVGPAADTTASAGTGRAARGTVALQVHNNGPAIAPDHIGRVFDRFFTERPDRRGTGLGLSLVRAIVEAHGGTVTASSPPTGGASFEIRLPALAR